MTRPFIEMYGQASQPHHPIDPSTDRPLLEICALCMLGQFCEVSFKLWPWKIWAKQDYSDRVRSGLAQAVFEMKRRVVARSSFEDPRWCYALFGRQLPRVVGHFPENRMVKGLVMQQLVGKTSPRSGLLYKSHP
jgi:ABC-type sugar transport system ATPase subunit